MSRTSLKRHSPHQAIDFNLNIDEQGYFETSTESISGFEVREMQPD